MAPGADGMASLGRHHRVMLQPKVIDGLPDRATAVGAHLQR